MLSKFILLSMFFAGYAYVYRRRNGKLLQGEVWTQRRPTVNQRESYTYSRRQAGGNRRPANPNFDNTFFCSMPEMEQNGATLLLEENYPWIARIVFSSHKNELMEPLGCTAAAIRKEVFITAARCIVAAKAEFTTILYANRSLGVKAFITPINRTKQMFDDVGLIAAWAPWDNKAIEYIPIRYTTKIRNEPNNYDFFEDWAGNDYTVIGFIPSDDKPADQYLYKLDNMHASNSVCNKLYPVVDNSNDYWAPCVHSCDVEEYAKNSQSCYRFLLGLGHVLLNKDGELVGVVSWTCGNYYEDRVSRGGLPLPLGVVVPNKDTFQTDVECARKIEEDPLHYNNKKFKLGYYYKVCELV